MPCTMYPFFLEGFPLPFLKPWTPIPRRHSNGTNDDSHTGISPATSGVIAGRAVPFGW
jgi:hypothetical protein